MRQIKTIMKGIFGYLQDTRIASIVAKPGKISLTKLELDLYEKHAEPGNTAFESPIQILNFLNERLGYERLKEGAKVLIQYRPQESDVLVRPFNARRGEVIGMDNSGRPWVRFSDKDWDFASRLSITKSSDVSPYESGEFDNIQPRLRSIRLDPLDVWEYRNQISRIKKGQPIERTISEENSAKTAYFYDPNTDTIECKGIIYCRKQK